jgi:hypothetical protein
MWVRGCNGQHKRRYGAADASAACYPPPDVSSFLHLFCDSHPLVIAELKSADAKLESARRERD